MIGGGFDPVRPVEVGAGNEAVPFDPGGGLAVWCEFRVRVGPDHQPVPEVWPFHRQDVLVRCRRIFGLSSLIGPLVWSGGAERPVAVGVELGQLSVHVEGVPGARHSEGDSR